MRDGTSLSARHPPRWPISSSAYASAHQLVSPLVSPSARQPPRQLISSSAYPSARGLLPQQTFDLSSKVRDKGGMRLPRRRAIEPGVHPLDPSVPPDEQGGRIRHEVHQLRLRRL